MMRFMTMVKSTEKSGPPPMALMDAIAQLGAQAAKEGVLVETGGLMPSMMGARIRVAGGKMIVTDGPFMETKEVVGGYAVYEVNSKEEAIKHAQRFMQLHIDHWPSWEGETELRQIFGAADFANCGK